MWFKNIRLKTLATPIAFDELALAKQLENCRFKPCAKSLPSSYGFVPPVDEKQNQDQNQDQALVLATQGALLIKLRIEEKILPPSVVRDALAEEVKSIEASSGRRLYRDEKERLKDEIHQTLLTKAFSRFTHIHAYIDTERQWLIVDAASPKRLALFCSLFTRCVENQAFEPVIEPIPPIATKWLLQQNYPASLAFAKACLMKAGDEQGSIVRVKNIELENEKVQSFLRDGSFITELALEWQQQLRFTLKEDFCLANVKFLEGLKELADYSHQDNSISPAERAVADLSLMTATLRLFLDDLLSVFSLKDNLESITLKQSETIF
jgi:recombination associated protein RdgC